MTLGEPSGQLLGRSPLQFLQRRKLGQEGQARFGMQIAWKDLQGLRIRLFQTLPQLIFQADTLLDPIAALFCEHAQGTTDLVAGLPEAKPIDVLAGEPRGQFGVHRVILGAAGVQGLAVGRQLRWVQRTKQKKVVLHQAEHQRSTRLLQTDHQRPAGKPFAHLGDPGGDRLGLLLERALTNRLLMGCQNAKGVFLIAPINAHEHRTIQFLVHRKFSLDRMWKKGATRWPWRCEVLIVRRWSSSSEHSSMAKARRPAQKSGLNRRAIGQPIRCGAPRVLEQSTLATPGPVNRLRASSCREARGSCRMACPLLARE